MQDPVTGLMRLGLTEYDARAYVAIASLGEGGIGDISLESGIPRARVYDIMERLAGKGFVEVGSSKPLRYRANEPKRVMEGLVDDLKATTNDVTLQLTTRKRKTQKSLTPIWVIPDDRGIDIKLKELFDSSTEYITVIAYPTCIFQKCVSRLAEVSKKVKVKVMILHDAKSFKGLLGEAEMIEPPKALLPNNNWLPTFTFHSRNGKRTIKFELVVISDNDTLVVYKEEDDRVAMSIDDSFFDWVLRSTIDERVLKTRSIKRDT